MRKNLLSLLAGFIGAFLALCLLAFTYTYDTTTPAGTDLISMVDDRIKEMKLALQERINVDHFFQLTGSQVRDANVGQHRRITLVANQTATATANCGILHSKDVDSKAELFYLDEDNHDVQITSGGLTSMGHTQTAKTTDYTVTAAELENNTTFTNTGASAVIVFTLPAGSAGYKVGFLVTDTDGIRIDPPATESFYMVNIGSSSAGKYIGTTTIGSYVEVEFDGTYWTIVNIAGIWDIES